MSRFQMYPHQRGRKTLRVRFILFYFFSSCSNISGLVCTGSFYFDSPYGMSAFFLSCRDPKLVFCRIAL